MPHRILVVDDEDSVQTVIEEFLTIEGYSVQCASDGETAIQLLDTVLPHLALIDFLLPKKNGFAVAEAIRNHAELCSTPIIMMSGVFKNPKTATEAREKYQVLEFLAKPLNLADLAAKIRVALADVPSEVSEPNTVLELVNSGPTTRPTVQTNITRALPYLPEQASIEDFPPALIISVLRYDRLTGMLDMIDGTTHRRIYVVRGEPTFMQSNAEGENVGALLLQRGRITRHDFERCSDYMKTKRRTLQQSLLELSLTSEQDLATAYKLLAGELLPRAIGMSVGRYHWRETDVFLGRIPEGHFEASELVFEGIKRYVDFSQVTRFFESKAKNPISRTEEFESLMPVFSRIFSTPNMSSQVDGAASFESLTSNLGSSAKIRVALQLFALVASGMAQCEQCS